MNTFCKRMIWAATLAGGLITATAGASSASSDGPLDHLLGGSGSSTVISVEVPVAGIQADVAVGPKTSVEVGPTHQSHSHSPKPAAHSERLVGDVDVSPKVKAPVHVGGVAVGVLGKAHAVDHHSSAPASTTRSTKPSTHSAKHSLLGDVTASPDVSVPVSLCGVAAGVLGDASATCPAAVPVTTPASSGSASSGSTSSASNGGVDVSPVVNVPLDICGIGIGVLGDASTSCGGTTNPPTTTPETTPPTTTPPTTTPPTTTPSGTTPPVTTPPATTPSGTTPSAATPAETGNGATVTNGGSITVPVAGGSAGAGSTTTGHSDVCLNAGLMTAGLTGGANWMTQLITLLGAALGAFFLGMTLRTPSRRIHT